MPKPKTRAAERAAEQYEKKKRRMFPEAYTVLGNIDVLCAHNGYSGAEMCRATGMSPDTLTRRRKRPETFTEFELAVIAELFGVTVASLHVKPTFEPVELLI